MNKEQVIETYKILESIKATSRQLGISEATVRKVLIDAGAFTSDAESSIRKLAEQGMSRKEIAEKLGCSESKVASYMAYKRNPYFSDQKTKNAQIISKWRLRKKDMEEKNKE